MNAQVKKLWVEALRSGEWEQGKGVLRDNNKFCCLGVLCDLYSYFSSVKWSRSGNDYIFDVRAIFPPEKVQNWVDLSNTQMEILARMNDAQGKTFLEIADYIEFDFI